MAKFSLNDEVLASHTGLLYTAKVTKIKDTSGKGGGNNYFLHYNGWSKKWDEWVKEADVLPVNEENRKKQKNLQLEAKKKKGKKGKRKAAPSPPPPVVEKEEKVPKKDHKKNKSSKEKKPRKKRKKEFEDDNTVILNEERSKTELTIKIPGQIKKQLISDWECITQQSLLVPVPRKPCVEQIFADFVKSKTRKQDNAKMIEALVKGLIAFFNRSVGCLLLYRFERPQFKAMRSDPKLKGLNHSQIYGAEHLARLFVRLPEMLSHTNLEANELSLLQKNLTEFLKYMAGKHGDLFSTQQNYEATSRDYHASVE